MTDGTLYIGNKRYSSWSMRGWLAVKMAGLDVAEHVIRFTRPGPTQAIAALSPNGLVPLLDHKGALVWESLAICDYCAEAEPSLRTAWRGRTPGPSPLKCTPGSATCAWRCG